MLGIYHESQRRSPGVVCGVEEKHGEKHVKEDEDTPSDNKGEYTSDPFLQLYRDESIERHFTVRKIPKQYEVAERMNKTLLEKVWCMLSNTDLSKTFGLRHWRMLDISSIGCRRLQ